MIGSEDTDTAGIRLTHPDRVFYKHPRVTKRDLAEYYRAAGSSLLTHAQNRPLSLVRCPDGISGDCFFQKHVTDGTPAEIGRVEIAEKQGGAADYPVLKGAEGLAACAQIGVLELHLWASRTDRLERPDRLVFDLDPAPELPFAEVREAAFDMRDILDDAGLVSYALLTGGKGIHLVLPMERRLGWEAFAGFARGFASQMVRLRPMRFVDVAAREKRSGRIFIDYLRNARGNTAIAPFSPRAKPGAPVAVPVAWDQLADIERSAAFTLADTETVLGQAGAWRDYKTTHNRLSRKALSRLGIGRSLPG